MGWDRDARLETHPRNPNCSIATPLLKLYINWGETEVTLLINATNSYFIFHTIDSHQNVCLAKLEHP